MHHYFVLLSECCVMSPALGMELSERTPLSGASGALVASAVFVYFSFKNMQYKNHITVDNT